MKVHDGIYVNLINLNSCICYVIGNSYLLYLSTKHDFSVVFCYGLENVSAFLMSLLVVGEFSHLFELS